MFLVVELPGGPSPSEPRRGRRLREAREAQGISLRELARRLNVSPGHVSQIERDIAAPSISLLYSIVTELGVSMDALFKDDATTPPAGDHTPAVTPGGDGARRTVGRGEETVSAARNDPEESRYVRRTADRRVIMAGPGVRWELLTPSAHAAIDFREIVYQPTPEAAEEAQMIRHSGYEYGVVLSGTVHVQIEFETFVLGPGDSIGFESYRPHRFWNEGPEEARTIWVSNVQS